MASQGMLHADAFFHQEGALFSTTAPAEGACQPNISRGHARMC